MSQRAQVSLTTRDRQLLRTAWSLGWATCDGLTALVAPHTSPKTLGGRLTQLTRAGFLRQVRLLGGPGGHIWLYGTGPRAGQLDDAYRRPWRPPLLQTEHTLAVERCLIALHRPALCAPLTLRAWQGEGEVRSWAQPGEPYPDLRVEWAVDGRTIGANVEVDRGTQGRGAWRRKLARYLLHDARPLLVVTSSGERARNLAELAGTVGVPLLSMDGNALSALEPVAYDSVRHERVGLGAGLQYAVG